MSITEIKIKCDQVPSDPRIKWSPRKLRFSTTKIRDIYSVAALASHHVMGVLIIATLFGENMYVRAACADRLRYQIETRREKKKDPLANLFSINLDIPYQCHRPRTEKTKANTRRSKGKRARRSYQRKLRKVNKKAQAQKLKFNSGHLDSTTYRYKKRAHQYLCFRLTKQVNQWWQTETGLPHDFKVAHPCLLTYIYRDRSPMYAFRHHQQNVVRLKREHRERVEGEFLQHFAVMFETPPAYQNLPPAQPVAYQPIGPQRRRNQL